MSKNLGVWQFISLVSRFTAMFVGIAQSILMARILSISEFGVIGLITAIGALAGTAQHLGLASGTTREISAAVDKEHIFKIVLSSLVIKYVVTVPIALFLLVAAPVLATNVYHVPEIVLPLRLFALVLIIQGVQSIFNSVIAGLQKFKHLFIFQIGIAVVSLFIYVPMIYYFRVNGYFYSLVIFNAASSLILAFLALLPLRKGFKLPTISEFKSNFKTILGISLGIYVVKVLYTLWYKMSQLTLGYFTTLELVGIFSFALLYASKLQTVSDALTDVNLPVFTKEFSSNFDNFKKLFRSNFNKLYAFIMFIGVSAIYWSKEIFLLAVEHKYDAALPLVPILILAFIFYSYMNLLKSSVFVPAKHMRNLISCFIVLFGAAAISVPLFSQFQSALYAMASAMFVGSLFGFLSMGILIKAQLGFVILDKKDFVFTILMAWMLAVYYIPNGFGVKLLAYAFLALVSGTFVLKSGIVNLKNLQRKLT